MSNYTGCKCPVCGEVFTDNDDIVVCPDCGAPCHRSCWNRTGSCHYAHRHGSGFEWKPDKAPEEKQASLCPRCGASNPVGSRFCNNCGASISGEQPSHTAQAGADPLYGRNSATGARPQYDACDPVPKGLPHIQPDDMIDGIKARDWAAFFGVAAPFYLLNFQRMAETGRKISISFSAFLFGPFYFLYRKAWKPAFVFSLITLLLNIPGVLSLLYIAGALPGFDPAFLNTLGAMASYVDWVQMFFRGVFGVYLYKQAVAPRVAELCRRYPEGRERSIALAANGGTSIKAVLLGIGVCFALYTILVLFITYGLGPEAIQNITAYAETLMSFMA